MLGLLFANQEYAETDFSPNQVCDGQFEFPVPNPTGPGSLIYTARLNSTPTTLGCKTVLRLRGEASAQIKIQHAGYTPTQLGIIERSIRLTEGLVLFCGPTNSGKSSSLTSIISSQPMSRCIIELADPIECVLDNVTPIDISPRGEGRQQMVNDIIEATVRQDTDILVLGEIRDPTIGIAEKLAEQGKLVVSTLHTASVSGVYNRLTSMGCPSALLASPGFFRAAVAQRLAPLLCEKCSRPQPSPTDYAARGEDCVRVACLASAYSKTHRGGRPAQVRYRNPDGCPACRGSGVKGRTLVAEAMEVTEEVRAIYASGDLSDLRRHLIQDQGMESIHTHGLIKVASGALDPLDLEDRIEPIWPEKLRLSGGEGQAREMRDEVEETLGRFRNAQAERRRRAKAAQAQRAEAAAQAKRTQAAAQAQRAPATAQAQPRP